MKCPFCDIEKNRIISQGKYYIVLLSNPRLIPGHTLLVPKRHIEKISQLNKNERIEIFDAVVRLEEKILKTYSAGCDIRTHFRPFLKQSDVKVNHLHFHFHPREFEDELYKKSQIGELKMWKKLTKTEKNKFTKLFGN